jgi:hypothetical protein
MLADQLTRDPKNGLSVVAGNSKAKLSHQAILALCCGEKKPHQNSRSRFVHCNIWPPPLGMCMELISCHFTFTIPGMMACAQFTRVHTSGLFVLRTQSLEAKRKISEKARKTALCCPAAPMCKSQSVLRTQSRRHLSENFPK